MNGVWVVQYQENDRVSQIAIFATESEAQAFADKWNQYVSPAHIARPHFYNFGELLVR